MISEAIILAGGLGTRLQEAVPDLPKCMAPVNGKPFIHFVIAWLEKYHIEQVIFSLGYKSETVIEYLDKAHPALHKTYVVEPEPLGTGGAIKTACEKLETGSCFVVNGDSLFNIDLDSFAAFHASKQADCSIALKEMFGFERYGIVHLEDDQRIASFKEKAFQQRGLINGGIYALDKKSFLDESLPAKFSFEKDYLEKFTGIRNIYGQIQDAYFIDIGVPEDYERAQGELGG